MIRDSARAYGATQLAHDLQQLGVAEGDTLLVHVSLSRLGYVTGGAVGVLQALRRAVGPRGTLVMPAQSADLTDPAAWRRPAVPPQWLDDIRREMPAFDRQRSPTWHIGVVAELFRTWPKVLRSGHPVCSFAAEGPLARAILEPHGLDDPFGVASPLGRLAEARAHVLLMAAPWTACTGLHLAERLADPTALPLPNCSPVRIAARRTMVTWLEYPHDSDRFCALGAALEAAGLVHIGRVGEGIGRYLSLPEAIEFATAWLRSPPRC